MPEFNKLWFIKECIYILSGYLKYFKYKKFNPTFITAGNRNRTNGSLNNVGSNGNYWTTSISGSNSRNLNFNSTNANFNSNNRANGFSVRCVC